jgi:hypothetical protein
MYGMQGCRTDPPGRESIPGLLKRSTNTGCEVQGVKNWILPKEMNANRFFRHSHWLEIWKKQFLRTAVQGAQINIGDLTPYLTYGIYIQLINP